MAERSFKGEAALLRLRDGETFHGEGIVAVTKALLQSGVSYVGGYQGSPVSHLVDLLVDSADLLGELGVHLETCANEASAAAMLGASVVYPARGAVAWKSIVGTNVASDALSSLASTGVVGGALIVVGEDYGEGAAVAQERTHAFAMKSSIWLLDPRPNLPKIVDLVETSFALSEASNTPVMMELRIRACHMTGSFTARDNVVGEVSSVNKVKAPPAFSYDRLAHPPATFSHERLKYSQRRPAAEAFAVDRGINERFGPPGGGLGIIVQGGHFNTLHRALDHAGLLDENGEPTIGILVLNLVYPLIGSEVIDFCRGRPSVLVIEEGQPEFIEQEVIALLHRANLEVRVSGKNVLPMTGDYTVEKVLAGLRDFLDATSPNEAKGVFTGPAILDVASLARRSATALIGDEVPPRPPTFCTGCPERPVFTAIKLLEREMGRLHIAGDVGCHSLATFAPFSLGHSILGYGMGLASSAAVGPMSEQRPVAIMGDGGLWHNGLLSGISSAAFNGGDGVLVVLQNGYSSATGAQSIPSSNEHRSPAIRRSSIQDAMRGVGVRWLRTVRSYSVEKVRDTLREALTTKEGGLKVIVADGECQLARQRRLRADTAKLLREGQRVVSTRYGVDEAICTGDHSCIRLSGCPSLGIKQSSDPLRQDPVATVLPSCVGCGHCGEVAHAAVLCPSFHQVNVITNPGRWETLRHKLVMRVVSLFRQRRTAAALPSSLWPLPQGVPPM